VNPRTRRLIVTGALVAMIALVVWGALVMPGGW
jgi:hypothetical protein